MKTDTEKLIQVRSGFFGGKKVYWASTGAFITEVDPRIEEGLYTVVNGVLFPVSVPGARQSDSPAASYSPLGVFCILMLFCFVFMLVH